MFEHLDLAIWRIRKLRDAIKTAEQLAWYIKNQRHKSTYIILAFFDSSFGI